MRKITIHAMVTLDGVMQAPGGPKEDTSGRFKFGGWTAPYGDEEIGKVVQKELSEQTDYLLGRKTFDIWESYWPNHADFWPRINTGTKFILSKTRKKSAWQNTVFVQRVGDIKKLKASKGADIQVWGSSEVIELLLKNDLVDELRIKMYPIVLGVGKKLFTGGVVPPSFKLLDATVTLKGVIIAHYRRAGKVKTGSVKAKKK